MQRRTFLLGTTAASAALMTRPAALRGMAPPARKPGSVLVIGAGFAGLTAAHLLRKQGVKVTILEARNRVGGRVFSFHPEGTMGQVIELGAEWVGNSHTSLIGLCKEFGLELFNNQFDSHLTLAGEYSPAGKWSFSEALEAFWAKKTPLWEAYPEKDKRAMDKADWWRLLANMGFTDRDLLIRELLDSTDFGESIRHTSGYAAFAEYAESSPNNEMDLKIRGGNSRLAEKLAESVGSENILLNHKVASVAQSKKDGVKVTCADGKTFTADRLICTAPTWSVQRIQWTPALPAVQVEAMNALQYARIVKIPMVFKERFWKVENFDMVTDTAAHYFYHATKDQPGQTGVLISYVTGDKADSITSLTKQQREAVVLDALRPAFGDVKKYLQDSLMYYWASDPYSKGAYAFYGKGQWFGIMPVLREPHMLTHFAGEHLADWQGFMEGAINTAEEAVDQILG